MINNEAELKLQRVEKEISEKIAESIRKTPEKWSQDQYCLTGPGPIIFWTANGKDHFRQYRRDKDKNPIVLIGNKNCKEIIWPAYVEWRLQINESYLKENEPFQWKYLFRRKKKNQLLLEYKPEKPL